MYKRILLVLVVLAIIITIANLSNEKVKNVSIDQEFTMVIEETQTEETKAEVQENRVEETQTEETIPKEVTSNLVEYEGRQYVIPTLSLGREPGVTESGYIEKYTEVPQYFQTHYPKTRYGDSTVRKSGCGIASVSMVLTYLLDEEVSIDYLAEKYNRYKVKEGSSYGLFSQSAEDYEIEVTQVWNWEEVMTALENGHVVIANPKAKSVFTDGGHYMVLAGLTEDGKILVRDPNLYNYSIWANPILTEGFANGFGEESLKYHCFPCWIYPIKDLEAIATKAEQKTMVETEPTNYN